MMLVKMIAPVLLAGLTASPALAADAVSCQCKSAMTCTAEGCNDDSANCHAYSIWADGGRVTFCAYTGCWEGAAKAADSGDARVLVSDALTWSTGESKATVVHIGTAQNKVTTAVAVEPDGTMMIVSALCGAPQ